MEKKVEPTQIKKDISKDKRISAEEKRIKGCFGKISDDMMVLADGIIKRAAVIRIRLEDYEKDLDDKGYTEWFTQSEKTDPYERERPVARLYIAETKNYQNLMKQLTDMLPKDKGKDKGDDDDDGFEKFQASKNK